MIIETKLHVPKTSGHLIQRPHLMEQLQKGLDKKLTLVVAPAGYGKSTLLSEWSKVVDADFAWISLDENDNDPMRFWNHTIESLKRYSKLFSEQFGLYYQSEDFDVTGTASISQLLNRLNRLTNKVVLVWDDLHYVNNDIVLNQMDYFLEHLPPTIHICIASRTYPTIPISKMRLQGKLNEINSEDLRFGKNESIEFFNYCTNLSINQNDLLAILDKTEGWIAGMRLLASMKDVKKESPANLINRMSGDYYIISDYFFEEVFSRQTDEFKNLLLKTSILNRIHVSLVDVFSNIQTGAKWIQLLESENLFLISLDHNRTWYRYHHLFQEFLQRKLFETLPEELPKLYETAGKWFEENDFHDEAIDYYLSGQLFEQAINLIENLATKMIHTNLIELRSWFDKIPDLMLLEKPQLLIDDIFSLFMLGKGEQANRKLEKSLEVVKEPSVRSGLKMLSVMGALFSHNIELFIELSEQYVQEYPDADHFISLGTEGDLQIPKWSFLEPVGNLKEREAIFLRLINVWSKSKHYYFTASLYIAYGDLFYEWGNFKKADYYFQKGYDLGERHGNKLLIITAQNSFIKLNIAKGNLNIVEELRHELEVEVDKTIYPKLYEYIQLFQTHSSILLGDFDQALKWLETNDLQVNDDIPETMFDDYHIFATLLSKQSNKDDAISLMLRLLREARRTNRTGDVIRLLIQYSILLSEKGDMQRSIDVLEEALSLSEKNYYKMALVEAGKPLAILLQYYLVTRQKEQRKIVHFVRISYVKKLLHLTTEASRLRKSQSEYKENEVHLTQRESLVLQLLMTSLTNKEIANELDVSLSTIKTHINSIYGKLKVANRFEAIERARLLKLL